MSRASRLVVALAMSLAACNSEAPWRTRPPVPPSSTSATPRVQTPSVDASDATAANQSLAALTPLLRRVAWARVRWPEGDVLEGHDPTRLDEAVLAGSLFKVIAARAALEQGVITPATAFACPRRLDVHGRRVDCVHPDLARPLTLADALAHSCNHFFVRLGERLDRRGVASTLRRLSEGRVATLGEAPLPLVVLGLDGPTQGLHGWMRTALAALRDDDGDGVEAAPLRQGMARGVSEGTAVALQRHGEHVLAKTGTTTADGMQDGRVIAWRPEIGEAVLVRAPGASGRDAARLAAAVWERAALRSESSVRVGRVRTSPDRQTSRAIDDVPIEVYVADVVAAEGDARLPAAVLEALAVVARSYARAPDGRHVRDGFDVCDTTHCQVVGTATAWSRRAAAATRGLVLTHEGRVVGVPYSASCAGLLVSPRELWGGDQPVLTVVGTEPAPHAVGEWSSDVDQPRLLAALREAGVQGSRLEDLRVVRRTEGVPQTVALVGLVPGELPATRFRTIIGRRLGWDLLKSDAWDVTRTSQGYRFSGRGKGHGAGLCLAGASRLAVSGVGGRRILGTYVPGAQVWSEGDRLSLRLPAAASGQLQAFRNEARSQLAMLRLTLGVTTPRDLVVEVHPTREAFQRATGRAWWTGASTRWLGGLSYRIDLAPPPERSANGALMHTLVHEFVHVLTASSLAEAPAWVGEGLASLAPRTRLVEQAGASGPCPTDNEIRAPGGLDAMRIAYARAEACVRQALPGGLQSWRSLAY